MRPGLKKMALYVNDVARQAECSKLVIRPVANGRLIHSGTTQLLPTTAVSRGRKAGVLCRCGHSGIRPLASAAKKTAGLEVSNLASVRIYKKKYMKNNILRCSSWSGNVRLCGAEKRT